jgi:uncharacterized protein YbbC (DUF1343 family)
MVKTGLDRLLANVDGIKKRSVGLIANHTSVSREPGYSWDLLARKGIAVKKIFSPEHGLFGAEQDQVPVYSRKIFPVEIISLYGSSYASLAPVEEHLSDLDCIIFDIQDVGARYYTYINTMSLFMRALQGRDIEFIVLDRPNPLGGRSTEGPVLKKGYESFVGMLPVPVRHGLTAGEIAHVAVDHFDLDIKLKVMEMSGWSRDMFYDETGLTWIPPSPNMPTLNTALVYPGACLFEGTNVSEGRGTTTPFEVIGAPGIEPYSLAESLNEINLPGVYFRPLFYRPAFNKHREETIGGVFIHVTDRLQFLPFLTGVAMTATLSIMMPGFDFTSGIYEFNDEHPAFDLLTGSSSIREMITAGKSLDRIRDLWDKEEKVFAGLMEEFHLYRN